MNYQIIYNGTEKITVNGAKSTIHARRIVRAIFKKQFKGNRKKQNIKINGTYLIVGAVR